MCIRDRPHTYADGAALLAGGDASDQSVQARAQGIRHWSDRARLFQLADRDNEIAALFEAMLTSPDDTCLLYTSRPITWLCAYAAMAVRVRSVTRVLLVRRRSGP